MAMIDAEKACTGKVVDYEHPVDWALERWQARRRMKRWLLCISCITTIAVLITFIRRSGQRLLERHREIRPTNSSIPSYVTRYAPLVWLDENEEFFPSSLLAHVEHTNPTINYSTITPHIPLNLANLHLLNAFGDFGGLDVYLTAKEDVTTAPLWLTGTKPDSKGMTASTSAAIICVPHDNGTLDAFYTYFYSYNRGATVLGHELGNHVGDWEHNMIRFQNGTPTAVWYSQHGGGQAFSYSAVEKIGVRPIGYSARGSHANYAVPGRQERLLPGAHLPFSLFLTDYTSRGTLWDPVLNAHWYTFNPTNRTFHGATNMGKAGNPIGAMDYRGRWGDQQYGDGDRRQESWWGWKKFVDGPTGPRDKDLVRRTVCPHGGLGLCSIKTQLSGWSGTDDEYWMPPPEGKEWD